MLKQAFGKQCIVIMVFIITHNGSYVHLDQLQVPVSGDGGCHRGGTGHYIQSAGYITLQKIANHVFLELSIPNGIMYIHNYNNYSSMKKILIKSILFPELYHRLE